MRRTKKSRDSGAALLVVGAALTLLAVTAWLAPGPIVRLLYDFDTVPAAERTDARWAAYRLVSGLPLFALFAAAVFGYLGGRSWRRR